MQESHDMTLGSFFDGIGGWLLAARPAGVTPVWASEIEPFPCADYVIWRITECNRH